MGVALAIKVADLAVRIGFFKRTDGDIGVGFLEGFLHGKNHARVDGVVAVNESDIFAFGEFEAGVASGGETLVLLVLDLDAGVVFGVVVGNLTGIISGSVVDTDDFEVFVSLVF